MLEEMFTLLLPSSGTLGDNGLRGAKRTIVPYTRHEIDVSLHGELLSTFNHIHSSSRMTAEHGIGKMKSWAIIRGRDDISLFDDENDLPLFEISCKIVQSLINYSALKCPSFP